MPRPTCNCRWWSGRPYKPWKWVIPAYFCEWYYTRIRPNQDIDSTAAVVGLWNIQGTVWDIGLLPQFAYWSVGGTLSSCLIEFPEAEVADGYRVLITDYTSWHFMESSYVLNKYFNYFLASIGMSQCSKISIFAQPINNHHCSLFPPDLGIPSTKSRDTSSHTQDSTGNGCNSPTGGRASYLFYWQTVQAVMYFWTSLHIDF